MKRLIPLLFAFACADPAADPAPVKKQPTLPTVSIELLSANDHQAQLRITVTGDPVEMGVHFGLTPSPNGIAGTVQGSEVTIDIEADKKYYARGYAKNGAGVGYSPDIEFFSVCPTSLAGAVNYSTVPVASQVPIAPCLPSVSGTTLWAKVSESEYLMADATFGLYGCAWNDGPATGVVLKNVCGKISMAGADQYGLVYSWQIVSNDGQNLVIDWQNNYGDKGRSTLTRTGGWPVLWQ